MASHMGIILFCWIVIGGAVAMGVATMGDYKPPLPRTRPGVTPPERGL
jgi:hypothetical protein